ncbi:hypothetical protein KR200_005926 [Drosophila serrata]|nr:hypothetical protein KR200_005926 [Drosophila serrata]
MENRREEELQRTAEDGITLMERNEGLNTELKVYKSKADDQEQELLHLRKLLSSVIDENDARLKVYEKMDIMFQELEHANNRLHAEKCQAKDRIKKLNTNVESLEARCMELTQKLSLARQSLNKIDRYRQEQHTNTPVPRDQNLDFPEIQSVVLARHENVVLCHNNLALSLAEENFLKSEDSDDLIKLLGEMEIIMRDYLIERRRRSELEEHLRAVIQENRCLQGRLAETTSKPAMMSIQEEFSLLDEVRQGQMCSRCLGILEECKPNLDEVVVEIIEDDSLKTKDNLPMNNLENSISDADVVEEYETLLVVQQTSSASRILEDINKTIDLNPSPIEQRIEKDTKDTMALLDMAPFALREVETSSSEADNKFSQTDIFYTSSSSGNISVPPVLMESSREVSQIMSCQSLAITERVPQLECKSAKSHSSFFNTTPKLLEKSALVMRPLKREIPENNPIPMGMKKKNRRKHHHHQSSDSGTGNIPQLPQLQMGQSSVSGPVIRNFGWDTRRRGNPTPLSPPPAPMLTNLIKNPPSTSGGQKKSEISYAAVLRTDNTPTDNVPSKLPGIILSKRLQQTNNRLKRN